MQIPRHFAEQFPDPSIEPIKKLYAAMLELAMRDLINGNRYEITCALGWIFASDLAENDTCITYKEIADTLELSGVIDRHIKETVAMGQARYREMVAVNMDSKVRGKFIQLNEYTKVSANGRVVRKFRGRN